MDLTVMYDSWLFWRVTEGAAKLDIVTHTLKRKFIFVQFLAISVRF